MDGFIVVIIIYVLFIARPAIILSIFPVLPIWFLWIFQKIFHRKLYRPYWIGTSAIVTISFISSLIVFVYFYIDLGYSLSGESSPIYDEMIKYRQEVIPIAFRDSLIPPFLRFADSCINKPQIVCELIESHTLNLWSFNEYFDGIPYLSAITSALTSMLLIFISESLFHIPNTPASIVKAKISLLQENADVDGLLKILASKRHWMFKLDAAEALAKLGNEQGLNYIINSLDSSDEDQREVAKEILVDLNDQLGILALESGSIKK